LKYKIGIIGGAGFIGASLARHLIKNFQVKLLDAKPPPKDPKEATNYHYCDIRNCEEVAKGLANVDLAIHAAIVQIPLINEQKKLGYEVNVIGTQNVCKVVEENQRIKGMILAGSWHTVGERDLKGVIDEEFGFRPDKVENRARLYALSKMAQEAIVRFYDEMSDKIYGITRMGTVLGDGMPVKTAANIFIEKGLKGDPITPFRHSMYRPMLYLDVHDACRACETYALKILKGESEKTENSLAHVVNLYHPKPINILHLAEIVKNTVIECSHGRIIPTIEIIDKRLPILFEEKDVEKIEADISKVRKYLGIRRFKSPPESISQIVFTRFNKMRMRQDPNSPQSKPRCN
jgi:nucleoside-diphosphate-sugar epimerase